jgi:hypothetical protein
LLIRPARTDEAQPGFVTSERRREDAPQIQQPHVKARKFASFVLRRKKDVMNEMKLKQKYSLMNIIDVYQLSTGRRMFALRQMKPIASELNQKALVSVVNRALEHDAITLALEKQWSVVDSGTDPQQVKKIDQKVDRILAGIRDLAEAQAAAHEPGDLIHERATELLRTIYPAGLYAVTNVSHVEELILVEAIVKQLKGELAEHVKVLGLSSLAQKLAGAAIEYRDAQLAPAPAEVRYEAVRAARELGHEYMLEAIALVVGAYHSTSEEHRDARARLLGPILEQSEELAMSLRRKKPAAPAEPIIAAPEPAPVGGAPPVVVDADNDN